MSKQACICTNLYSMPNITSDPDLGMNLKVKLPEGCVGIMFVFESKTAARKWQGQKASLVGIDLRKIKTI